jgi:hypothetical protein
MADKNDLTTRENEVLALAWQCFDNEPKVRRAEQNQRSIHEQPH